MLYQESKRYVIRLLMVLIFIIMLAIIGDEAPFLMLSLLIVLIALTGVLLSYDRFSLKPSLLIKLYLAVNTREPSTLVRNVLFQIDRIVSCINVDKNYKYDGKNLIGDFNCLLELQLLVNNIIKIGFIKGETVCICVPDFANYTENKQYSLSRNDIAPILHKFEAIRDRIDTQLVILAPLVNVVDNQEEQWVDDIKVK